MKKTSRNAFTLLEIMIAMAIFSVVVAAVYSSWSAIVRGAKVGANAAAAAQRSRIALHAIEDALLTSQLYTENARYYNFIADTSDPKFAWLSLTARLPQDFPGAGFFGEEAATRRVTFSVQPGADGTNELIVSQIPYLQVTNENSSEYPITLARDVSLFALEFWDTNVNDWVEELQTTNQLPKMVRVTLGLGQTQGYSSRPAELVSRIVSLPSLAVTADVQRPGRPGVPPGGGGPLPGPGRGGGGGRGGGNGGREGGRGGSNGGRDGNRGGGENRNNRNRGGNFFPGTPGNSPGAPGGPANIPGFPNGGRRR